MQVCKHIYTCIFYLSWLGVRRVSMVTHPSYQIFPYSRCSSPFLTLNYSLSLSIQYFYFLLPSCSVILSLSHLFFFPFLCVSLSVTPSIYSSVSPCVFISLYFCFPHYQSFCLTHVYPILSPFSFSFLLGRVLRASLFSFLFLLSHSVFLFPLLLCSQSFATEENYSLSILETPTLDHETNFFHRGEFPLPAYIRILFTFFFQGTIMTSGMIFWGQRPSSEIY